MGLARFIFASLTATTLASCTVVVLKEEPAGGSIPFNEIVYIENDGRCSGDQVIEITGGNNNKNIPRKYSCVARWD